MFEFLGKILLSVSRFLQRSFTQGGLPSVSVGVATVSSIYGYYTYGKYNRLNDKFFFGKKVVLNKYLLSVYKNMQV